MVLLRIGFLLVWGLRIDFLLVWGLRIEFLLVVLGVMYADVDVDTLFEDDIE